MFSLDQKQVYLADEAVVCAIGFCDKWFLQFRDSRSMNYHILHSICDRPIPSTEKESGERCLSTAHTLAVDGFRATSCAQGAIWQVNQAIDTLFSKVDERKKAWAQIRQTAAFVYGFWQHCVAEMEKLAELTADALQKWRAYVPGKEYESVSWAVRRLTYALLPQNYPNSSCCFTHAIYEWTWMKAQLLLLESQSSNRELATSEDSSGEVPALIISSTSMGKKEAANLAKKVVYRADEAIVHLMAFFPDMDKWVQKWGEKGSLGNMKTWIALRGEHHSILKNIVDMKHFFYNWMQAWFSVRKVVHQVVKAIDSLLSAVDQEDERDRLKEARAHAYHLYWSWKDPHSVQEWTASIIDAECKWRSVSAREMERSAAIPSLNSVDGDTGGTAPLVRNGLGLTQAESQAASAVTQMCKSLMKVFPESEYDAYQYLTGSIAPIWICRLMRVRATLLDFDSQNADPDPSV
jgi:hypothetical protein